MLGIVDKNTEGGGGREGGMGDADRQRQTGREIDID